MAWCHRPARRWPRACRRNSRLADATGRRRGREALSRGAPRTSRGNQYQVGREARRIRKWRLTIFRRRGRKYRGQKQKWYALCFTGKDNEIDIENQGGGHDPQFIDWRWVDGKASRSRGAVQAADLRAGGQAVLKVHVSNRPSAPGELVDVVGTVLALVLERQHSRAGGMPSKLSSQVIQTVEIVRPVFTRTRVPRWSRSRAPLYR